MIWRVDRSLVERYRQNAAGYIEYNLRCFTCEALLIGTRCDGADERDSRDLDDLRDLVARRRTRTLVGAAGFLRPRPARGQQLNPPDTATKTRATSLMREPQKVLNEEEIQLVQQTLDDYLAPGMPGETWRTHATAIERTHVHLLFGPLDDPIGEVVGRIKSRTSSALLKLPANQDRRRIWTTGYWKVFLFNDKVMAQVFGYINAHSGRRGSRAGPVSEVEGLSEA